MKSEAEIFREAPWMAGIRAAKANFIPALIVQAAMALVVLGYFTFPPAARWLNYLASLKADWGYAFTALASVIAGSLIPETARIIFNQKGRLLHKNLSNLYFTIPYWVGAGVCVDLFYRLQAQWFGTEASLSVVTTKVLVDQLLYNPLFVGPVGTWLYDWKNSGYDHGKIGRFFTATYYRETVIPVLFATWIVWFPLVSLIYSLPSILQIPLFSLALAMWVILYTWISEDRQPKLHE